MQITEVESITVMKSISMLPVPQGLFGNTAAPQAGGLFGAAQPSAATGFGTTTGLFGQPNAGFGAVGTQVRSQTSMAV